jgi:hypothetical protein
VPQTTHTACPADSLKSMSREPHDEHCISTIGYAILNI